MAEEGDLFFALTGEHHDGHQYLGSVIESGVAGVVIDPARYSGATGTVAAIQVDCPRQALGRLATHYRTDFSPVMIAVGGSNGKTTTKDILTTILQERYATLGSQASYNNDVGVPLTLLRLTSNHRMGVLEVGTNHPGELAPLLRMIQPQIGVVTSIGREHLEFFATLEGVIQEEGWVAEVLPERGRLYLNVDCPGCDALTRRTQARVVGVGCGEKADWRIIGISAVEHGTSFDLIAPNPAWSGRYHVGLFGGHQALNTALAIAVAADQGLTRMEIERGLASCKPAPHRMEMTRTGGVTLLDDSYNANADSMLAALDTLRCFPCAGRRWAVLGEMAELGTSSEEAHQEVGCKAAEAGVQVLVGVGSMGHRLCDAAREAGIPEVQDFDSADQASNRVRAQVQAGDVVLIKGSRLAGLERILQAFRNEK